MSGPPIPAAPLSARIFRRPKSSMQSGPGNEKAWALVFTSPHGPTREALMGWWGYGDTQKQIRMHFSTREAAVAFAEANRMRYAVEGEPARRFAPKAYADNFRFDRKEGWTH